MTTITNHSEYTAAVNEAKLHDYRYFTLNAPTISDEQYDHLYFTIQDYETAHPEQTLADSPTQSAHGEVKNGHKQIRRRTEMLSTEKAQTIENVQKWMQKTTKKLAMVPGSSAASLYTVEWKYDGISLSLVYIDGQLTEASYGKGMEGNDCLAHCLKVQSIPNTIPAAGRVEVRGEMVVPFANLKKTGYKNCRSAASSMMAATASSLTECMEFIAYYIDGVDKSGYHDFVSDLMLLSMYKFQLGYYYSVSSSQSCHDYVEVSADNLEHVIERLTELRSQYWIPTDGLVIKVKDCKKWNSLGRNDHHPHYAIAYKFAAATAETTVTRIEITTGKTGKRTPVAYFEPITINGATYQKASVGSEAKLAELGIDLGSRVIVSLRNDVIPHIDGKVSPTPSLLEGEEVDTPAVEEPIAQEPCVIAAENNQSDPATETSESLTIEEECPSVSLTEEDIDDSEPIAPYIAPEVKPVVPSPEPICTPIITPERNHRPTPQQGTRRAPRRNYRMVGEPRTRTANIVIEQEKSTPWFAYVFATLAVIAFIILCFAGLGAAVFFLPLLAGAFK